MGTYDTRGGGPLSPIEPDYVPSDLEGDVLGVLEDLDKARSNARGVLQVVFKRIVQQRYPAGSVVDLDKVTVSVGARRHAQFARVLGHFEPEINLAHPEQTFVGVQCVTLLRDGTESENLVRFDERVLGRQYDIQWARNPQNERDQLIQLVSKLDADKQERVRW